MPPKGWLIKQLNVCPPKLQHPINHVNICDGGEESKTGNCEKNNNQYLVSAKISEVLISPLICLLLFVSTYAEN